MTKTMLTTTQITTHFKSHNEEIDKWDVEQIIKLIERDDYNQLLFDYGEKYCLIILDFFEKKEEYDTCSEIVKQIYIHNQVTGSEYRTRL